MNTTSKRILAKNVLVSNDTRATHLNNNDLIVGPSGCGKTGGYVIPNIRRSNESMIIADTKGLLCRQLSDELKAAGYEVKTLDFVNMERSCGYNPLDYIGRIQDGDKEFFREQDIASIANTLASIQDAREPFWDNSARTVITCLIAFVLEALPPDEHNMASVLELSRCFCSKQGRAIFEEFEAEKSDSYAVKLYKSMSESFSADKMWGSIMQFVYEDLKLFDLRGANNLITNIHKVNIQDLAHRKTALFVNVSDTDRAFDKLVNVFYTQALQTLCSIADRTRDGRLPVPVRFILDDFATNVYIPDFEKIISVIRSREISVSLILQSITQLETLYTEPQSKTIINNCDHLLYLGGQDVNTAKYIAEKANKTTDTILNMGLEEAFLFTRGQKPRRVEKVPPYADCTTNSTNERTSTYDKRNNTSFYEKNR